MYNYRLEHVITEDKKFGLKKSDGTWSGIIGMVVSRRADLGLNILVISNGRLDVVDFLNNLLIFR
jgi:hypothetical protein